MNIDKIIERELNKRKGNLQIVKVPAGQRPQADSLRELDKEIEIQTRKNDAMSVRSMIMARDRVIR